AERKMKNPPPRPFPWAWATLGVTLLSVGIYGGMFGRRWWKNRFRILPAQVIAAIESGRNPQLVDVRTKTDFETSPLRLPGAVRLDPDAVLAGQPEAEPSGARGEHQGGARREAPRAPRPRRHRADQADGRRRGEDALDARRGRAVRRPGALPRGAALGRRGGRHRRRADGHQQRPSRLAHPQPPAAHQGSGAAALRHGRQDRPRAGALQPLSATVRVLVQRLDGGLPLPGYARE